MNYITITKMHILVVISLMKNIIPLECNNTSKCYVHLIKPNIDNAIFVISTWRLKESFESSDSRSHTSFYLVILKLFYV